MDGPYKGKSYPPSFARTSNSFAFGSGTLPFGRGPLQYVKKDLTVSSRACGKFLCVENTQICDFSLKNQIFGLLPIITSLAGGPLPYFASSNHFSHIGGVSYQLGWSLNKK